MKYLLIIICFLFSSCAVMPINVDLSLDHCEDIRCVIKEVDKIPWDKIPVERMYSFMEGYQPAPLELMYDAGVLEIKEISPWYTCLAILGIGPISTARPLIYKHGDIGGGTVEYAPWLPYSNYNLAHELLHIKGVMDFYHNKGHYGRDQVKIMKEEGVSHWWETSIYKNEDPAYHWDKWWTK